MTDQSGSIQGDLSEGLARIAGLVLTEETLHSVLELVVALAKRTIGGVDGCGVTMFRDGKFSTAAHSDELVVLIDAKQYDHGSGPCVSAIEEGKRFRVSDLATDGRWEAFARDATAAGIRSVLSVPFVPVDEPIGALNIYSRAVGAFSEAHEELATLLAQQAGVVLANSQAYDEREEVNEQLREALRSREVIGQAKGILMHRDSISGDDAFTVLRKISQNSNRKLRDVADEIVTSVESGIRE